MKERSKAREQYDLLHDFERRLGKIHHSLSNLLQDVTDKRREAEEELIEEMRKPKDKQAA